MRTIRRRCGWAAWLVYLVLASAAGPVAAQLVDSTVKIAHGSGGLPTTVLENGDEFGHSSAALGDLDGDGFEDLIVGASHDDDGGTDRGAFYVLFLNVDANVRAVQKISALQGGLLQVLED